MANSVIILDNGASTIKAGLIKDEQEPAKIIPNAVLRSKSENTSYFGHEIERCTDWSSITYRLPFEKGYLVEWDAQKAVWDGIFSDEVFGIDTTESTLLITEPYFNLPNIQEVYDQFIFEEYEFQSYYRCTPASVIPFGNLFSQPSLPPAECIMVVDSGFSFTHVVPLIDGNISWHGVKRLDVGGKLLTNQLKELISFRQWDLMDQTFIIKDVKESCCFVSANVQADLEICRSDPKRNPIVREYILPDLSSNRKGHVRLPDDIVTDTDQILMMNNERFTVPELIFRPDDIGLDQAGLAETIALSISLMPDDLQGMFWSNIGLIGGNTKFPGFRNRMMTELQALAPQEFEVVIYECDDPITEAYQSAYKFASTPEFSMHLVTRAEYAESGSNASRRKFPLWNSQESEKEKSKDASKSRGKQREDDRSQASNKLTRTRSKVMPGGSAKRR